MKAYLEISNCCNRACSFCPGTKRNAQFAALPLLIRRIAALKAHADEVYFHLMGEPLFHPDFPAIVTAAERVALPVNITSNGTLLNDAKKRDALWNPVIRQINFSLQSLENREDAERYLPAILDFAEEALQRRPELYLNLRIWNLNKDFSHSEKNDFFLKELNRRRLLNDDDSLHFSKGRKSKCLCGKLYLSADTVFDWPSGTDIVDDSLKDPKNSSGKGFCHALSSQFAVLCNGDVVPCCLDADGIMTLGNMDRDDLNQILHSERAEKIRDGFAHGNAVESLCRTCHFKERFSAHRR